MNRADWDVRKAIEERVNLEDWYEWAQKPTEKVEYKYKPHKFELTETAKHVFGRGIKLFHSMIP